MRGIGGEGHESLKCTQFTKGLGRGHPDSQECKRDVYLCVDLEWTRIEKLESVYRNNELKVELCGCCGDEKLEGTRNM